MDKFGLINMNGRVYDPLVGRFLNPDIFVKDPTNPIDFNRYMYCHNNPLKYVDPSGYEDTVKLQEFTKQGKRSSPMFIESTSQHPDYGLSDYFISNSEPYVDPAYYAQQNMNNSKDKAKATLDNKNVKYPNLLPEVIVRGVRNRRYTPGINMNRLGQGQGVNVDLSASLVGGAEFNYNMALDANHKPSAGAKGIGMGLSVASTSLTGYQLYNQIKQGKICPADAINFVAGTVGVTTKFVSLLGYGGKALSFVWRNS